MAFGVVTMLIVFAGVWRVYNYRFSLRTLLVFFTIFGIYLGLRISYEAKRNQAIAEASSLGGRFTVMDRGIGIPWSFWMDRYQLDFDTASLDDEDLYHLQALSPSALWGLSLGNTGITDVGLKRVGKLSGLEWLSLANQEVPASGSPVMDRRRNCITDDGLKELSDLTRIGNLYLGGTDVTDVGLSHLSQLSSLGGLYLQRTNITGDGLHYIRELEHLVVMYLDECRITKEGYRELSRLTSLQCLGLNDTAVTDEDLVHLQKLKNLTTLEIVGTDVTDEGLRHFKAVIPGCRVNR